MGRAASSDQSGLGRLGLSVCLCVFTASCLDFDRYGEAPAVGGSSPSAGGGSAAGAPGVGGTGVGGESVDGGAGGGGGSIPPAECHDGVVASSEECEDELGPAGACVECQVVCSGDNETKIGTHCYFLDPKGDRNFQAAKPACNTWRKGAYVAAVETQAEQDALEPLFQGTIWLGGFKQAGVWTWPTGVPFGFELWDSAQNQPDNVPGERCMGVWNGSTAWHDMECQNTNQYLCEWAPPTE